MRINWLGFLREDPGYRSPGLEWVRIDYDPPIRYVFENGQDYQHPYVLSPTLTEVEIPASGEPVTTTFSISEGADDQFVRKLATVYPPTGSVGRFSTDTLVMVVRTREGVSYYVQVGLLSFDTASLSGTVNSATLKLYPTVRADANARNFRGEYYAWDGTDADYTDDGSTGTTAFEVPVSSIAPNTQLDLPLTNLGSINTTGDTKFRLHITGVAPTGSNVVYLASYEGSGLEAQLEVTYTP